VEYTYDYTDRAFYEAAYDLLVREVRAPADPSDKASFVDSFCQAEHRTNIVSLEVWDSVANSGETHSVSMCRVIRKIGLRSVTWPSKRRIRLWRN
jgi:hypothetical protein